MAEQHFLAFDLGAESGRAVVGTLGEGRIALREIHRFPNAPIAIADRLHWDVPALFAEIKKSLTLCASEGLVLDSVAVDTWGVDFGLLSADGQLLGPPFAYRDPRHPPAMADFLARVPRERIYELTGIQFLPFNTLFQLHARRLEDDPYLRDADRILFIPEIFTHLLSGAKTSESTIASTSQMIDPRTGDWSPELMAALDLPPRLLQRPLAPGIVVGTLLPALSKETGFAEIPVVATASHDTASAVAAVPAGGRDWAYISSGTWSCVGIETPQPLITPQTMALNFTNEGGIGGTIRLLKNVSGLWLLQQCRKAWSESRPITYEDMRAMLTTAPPFKAFIDPDDPSFLNPHDMPAAIQEFCRASGQPVPLNHAEIIRCAVESLALKYRFVFDELRQVAPAPIKKIHIIGGGSRHITLCQFTADAVGLPVVAGPAEATALGNIMGQAMALGFVRSLDETRRIIAASVQPEIYEPRGGGGWDAAYDRFRDILSRRKT